MYDQFKELLPTELSFYNDTRKTQEKAYVDCLINHEKHGPCLVLGSTIFYPQGGGQKGDRGVVRIDECFSKNEGVPALLTIKDTKKDGMCVLHLIEKNPDLDIDKFNETLMGELVYLEINGDFRLNQMRLHSIAHLIHFFTEQIAKKELPYPTSSDLQESFGVNKYDIANVVPLDSANKIIEKFKEFTADNHVITTYPDDEKEGYRYWQCGNYVVPCGGAHLNNTSEIGSFSVEITTKKEQTSIKFNLI